MHIITTIDSSELLHKIKINRYTINLQFIKSLFGKYDLSMVCPPISADDTIEINSSAILHTSSNIPPKYFHIECDSLSPISINNIKNKEDTMCDIVPFAFVGKMNGIFIYSPNNERIIDAQLVLEYRKYDWEYIQNILQKINDNLWYLPLNSEQMLSFNGENAVDMNMIFRSMMRFHCYMDIVANIRIYGLGIVDS